MTPLRIAHSVPFADWLLRRFGDVERCAVTRFARSDEPVVARFLARLDVRVVVWRCRMAAVEANPIQHDRTQGGFPAQADEGWQETRMRRKQTNPARQETTSASPHRRMLDGADRRCAFAEVVRTDRFELRLCGQMRCWPGRTVLCEPTQDRRWRWSGQTQASWAGRLQDGGLRAFVKTMKAA